MDSVGFALNALKNCESSISNINTIGVWLSIVVGAFSIFVTLGIVIFGVKYVSDGRIVDEKIRKEIAESTIEMRSYFNEKILAERDNLNKEINSLRTELSVVWLRNAVINGDKDVFAISKALETAIKANNKDSILAMVSQVSDYSNLHTSAVGEVYWNAMGFESKIKEAKSIFSDNPEVLRLFESYEDGIQRIKVQKEKSKQK